MKTEDEPNAAVWWRCFWCERFSELGGDIRSRINYVIITLNPLWMLKTALPVTRVSIASDDEVSVEETSRKD
jgi:hypothetical protein